MSTATPVVVTIALLRQFELRVDGLTVALPRSSQRVLAFLAAKRRPQRRLTVAATLWMDTTEQRAQANLRSALWKLEGVRTSVVTAFGDALALASAVEVDLDIAERHARAIIGHEALDAPPIDLVDDLLPDWDEDWLTFERERLRQLRLHALEALAAQHLAASRFADAVDAALGAVAIEPLRESAQRLVVEIHLAEGNVCEARRQYSGYESLLREELGIAPSVEFRRATFERHLTTPHRR